ncbi:DUF6879 family protein [Pseudonocardia acidicola]|nr:DUF6879 family protein [Pseudonocardia acidicola]
MTAAELRDFIKEHFTETAFRLEVLQQYEVASDGNDFGRYLRGEPAPTLERKGPWLQRLRNERARGLYRHRVRIVTAPVTDYTRFECEWGYAPNAEAGEDIRILDLAERDWPELAPGVHQDFWLLDNEHALSMHYGPTGEFLGATAEHNLLPAFRDARDLLWDTAEPFTEWWPRHIELHRDGRQAA